METVREILAAHHSGISKPGLLAWARLRIDAKMTEAQLDEELARLGDEVVDVDGFLYLRGNLEMARREAAPRTTAPRAAAPVTPATAPGAGPRRLPKVSRPRLRLPGIRALIWLALVLVWLAGIVGVPFGTGEATPAPTAEPAVPTEPAPGSPVGTVVTWDEVAVGDCLTFPAGDTFTEIPRVSCDSPHDVEVFLLADLPGADYPGDDTVSSLAQERCDVAFPEYTGSKIADQELLTTGWFTPTADGWADGDRGILCYLSMADGSRATRSYGPR